MKPGKPPVLAPNIRVARSDATIEYHFSAPTRTDAERILNRIRPRKPHILSPLVGTEQPPERYIWESSYSVDDEDLLRSIARIAACFARHLEIPIDRSEPMVRFARGEDIGWCPVGPVQSDVISVPDLPEHALYHGVFLFRHAGNAPLFAYVVLFQFCEFVVEFDANCPSGPVQAGYHQNLISGCAEGRPFEWILSVDKAREWVRERKLNSERLSDRFEPVQYYLSKPERLWIDRAIMIGMNEFYASTDRGATNEQASVDALTRANLVLKRYGIRIEKLEINERSGSDQS
jgi:hypothetical protein